MPAEVVLITAGGADPQVIAVASNAEAAQAFADGLLTANVMGRINWQRRVPYVTEATANAAAVAYLDEI